MAQRSYFRDASIAHKDNSQYWEIVHDDFVNDEVARLKKVRRLHIVSEFEKPVAAGDWNISLSFKVERSFQEDISHMMCPELRIIASSVSAKKKDVEEELLLQKTLTRDFWNYAGNLQLPGLECTGIEINSFKITKIEDGGADDNDWYLLQVLRPFRLTSDAVVKFEWKDIGSENWKEGMSWHCVDLQPVLSSS